MHRFLKLARKESEKSQARFKLGAVVAKGSRVLGKGYNCSRSHPKGSGPYSTRHAEVEAILDAKRRGVSLCGASIYVYRENHNLACPCEDCMTLIENEGITKVIYSE